MANYIISVGSNNRHLERELEGKAEQEICVATYRQLVRIAVGKDVHVGVGVGVGEAWGWEVA